MLKISVLTKNLLPNTQTVDFQYLNFLKNVKQFLGKKRKKSHDWEPWQMLKFFQMLKFPEGGFRATG